MMQAIKIHVSEHDSSNTCLQHKLSPKMVTKVKHAGEAGSAGISVAAETHKASLLSVDPTKQVLCALVETAYVVAERHNRWTTSA